MSPCVYANIVLMELERLLKGLADGSRLRIVNLLMHGELCGCDIQYVLQVSQPNVSRHLGYLKNAGLVVDRRDGYRIFYRLDNKNGAKRRLFGLLQPILNAEQALHEDIRRLKLAIRDGACTVSEFHFRSRIDAKRAGRNA